MLNDVKGVEKIFRQSRTIMASSSQTFKFPVNLKQLFQKKYKIFSHINEITSLQICKINVLEILSNKIDQAINMLYSEI